MIISRKSPKGWIVTYIGVNDKGQTIRGMWNNRKVFVPMDAIPNHSLKNKSPFWIKVVVEELAKQYSNGVLEGDVQTDYDFRILNQGHIVT